MSIYEIQGCMPDNKESHMNEEIIENEVNEVETPVEVDTNNEVDTEVNEVETNEEKAPEPEKPWKKKSESIPYDRFKEVNDRAKEYEAKVREYESELAKYKEKESSKPVISEVSDIRIEDYDTPQDWLAAREQFIQERTITEFENRQRAKYEAEQARQREIEIQNNFNSKLEASTKNDPEIGEAVEWFANQYADKLPLQLRYAIVTDENAPELIKHMAEDPTIMQEVLKGNQLDALRMMAKWSARYSREEVKSNSSEEPKKFVPSVPKTVKASTGSTNDPNKMSMDEYRAWRLRKRK